MLVLMVAFSNWSVLNEIAPTYRIGLIALGAFLMTCTVGPAASIMIDVAQPAFRVTIASVLTLFQNLFGLATGPLLVGAISDAIGLQQALWLIPIVSLVVAMAFIKASLFYVNDLQYHQN